MASAGRIIGIALVVVGVAAEAAHAGAILTNHCEPVLKASD